ncbi:hypothetical protein AB1Y20_018213 [Prymnesium parvum]|uniref:Uncharacterized protein n=1 Tax=Prymnesium parvum TaxID=97485 RepID=A0AB34JNB3_PRYPA
MPLAPLLALVTLCAAQTARLVARNRSLHLDGNGPHFFRAVLYSPTPWGADEDLFFKTDYYNAHWPALFERDLQLMADMGANAVRLHGFFGVTNGLGRHTDFLDAAYKQNISVLLSYDLVGRGANAVSLFQASDREVAAQALKTYLLAAKHPAVVLVFLGDSINRLNAGFVCDIVRDQFGFLTSLPCQFGEDIEAFARALDTLCLEARQVGLSCTVPLANLPLPSSAQVDHFGNRASRGVLDWLTVMAKYMPNMNVLSANLVPVGTLTNVSTNVTFELDLASIAELPPLPAPAQAGAWYNSSFPRLKGDRSNAKGSFYKLFDDDVVDAEETAAQASWLVSLTELLEAGAKFPNCTTCGPVSGGVVRSWRDELWRADKPAFEVWYGGKQSDCADNDVCFAMGQICPYEVTDASLAQSPCGAPFPASQPDDYVNEEWFGLIATDRTCECAKDTTSRTSCAPHVWVPRARPVYYALQSIWNSHPTAAKAHATEVFDNASFGLNTTGCLERENVQWACNQFPEQPRLQRRPGTLELYLDCELFLMRGVCYSPVPSGRASRGVQRPTWRLGLRPTAAATPVQARHMSGRARAHAQLDGGCP